MALPPEPPHMNIFSVNHQSQNSLCILSFTSASNLDMSIGKQQNYLEATYEHAILLRTKPNLLLQCV